MSQVVFPWCQSSAPNVGNVSLSTITRKDGVTGTLLILAPLSKSWNLTCPLWFTEESPLYWGLWGMCNSHRNICLEDWAPVKFMRNKDWWCQEWLTLGEALQGLHTWFLQQWQLGNEWQSLLHIAPHSHSVWGHLLVAVACVRNLKEWPGSQETIYWPSFSLFANLDIWLYPPCFHIFFFYAGRRSPALFHHSKVQRESFCLQQTG